MSSTSREITIQVVAAIAAAALIAWYAKNSNTGTISTANLQKTPLTGTTPQGAGIIDDGSPIGLSTVDASYGAANQSTLASVLGAPVSTPGAPSEPLFNAGPTAPFDTVSIAPDPFSKGIVSGSAGSFNALNVGSGESPTDGYADTPGPTSGTPFNALSVGS